MGVTRGTLLDLTPVTGGRDRDGGDGLKGEGLSMTLGGLIMFSLQPVFSMDEKERAEVEEI